MFKQIKSQVLDQFNFMVATGGTLFVTDANDSNPLAGEPDSPMWEAYLNGFEDPIERQEHNCSCCRHFIKRYGSIVIVVNNKLVTVWDFMAKDPLFNNSVEALGKLVRSSKIKDKFLNDTTKLGVNSNYDMERNCTWEHFYVEAPRSIVVPNKDRDTKLSDFRQFRQVFRRSLDELTLESTEIVLDLIKQGSLYRGAEFEKMVQAFQICKIEYSKLPEEEKDNYTWKTAGLHSGAPALAIRNTAVGTLLVNLSEGKDIDFAVTAWEGVMAPTNYKRPTAIITKGMIEQAEKEIAVLGIAESLGRRFAVPEDISVDNVIFVNRDAKPATNVFEELKEDLPVSPKQFSKVAEVTIDQFINEVLPTATGVEVLIENGHLSNLVSVIAPKEPAAPSLFKWNNPYSWSYVNALTDSVIKEKVKAAGGNVNGVIRVSLSWFNFDDLDLWVTEPNKNEIGFSTFRKPNIAPSTGQLDVDMNAGYGNTRNAVENITWTTQSKMQSGTYKVYVDQFAQRETQDVGCVVEIEHNGEIFTFTQDKKMTGKTFICEFTYDRTTNEFKIVGDVTNTAVRSQEKWGVSTNKFQKVSMIMNSPNHWNEQIGNKHVFFMIEGAKNDETPRGFFNEFLKDDLTKNRKVFEVLGAKLKVEPSDRQLTGVGFSTTQRNSIICKVKGSFDRVVKVTF